MPTTHVNWGSIELLHNAVRTLTMLHDLGQPFPVVEYRGKVKLHGSNCAVQVKSDGVFAQSRTALLTPEDDYKGFAAFVQNHESYFHSLKPGIVVFGEWCGPGVEKGMAISQATGKQFAIFAVKDGDEVIYEPAAVRKYVPAEGAPSPLHVLPWEGDAFAVDFGSREQLEAVAAKVNERVEAIEREDPWVKATFGLSGLGEGLVFYPVTVDGKPFAGDAERLAQLMWKAKGEKHRTAGTKTAAQVDASAVASIDEFVKLMVTDARLEQGLGAVAGGVRDPKLTGKFLTWVAADVEKESQAELAASKLTWAQVEKAVQTRARQWFQKK